MGALPTIKRFLADDFPGQADWIDRLLYPLNLLLNTIYANFNNGLTIQQNCLAQIKTISISGSAPKTNFPWKFSTAPIGVLLVNIVQTDGNPIPITNATTCDWSYAAGIVQINNITGLDSTHQYSATFYVIGG